MEHLICFDKDAKTLEKILRGDKCMLVIGSFGKKAPYGQVFPDDILYFTENDGKGLIKGKAIVTNAYSSGKLSPEEAAVILAGNKDKLMLTGSQFHKLIGKNYLVMIELGNAVTIEPIQLEIQSKLDDWIVIRSL